MLCNPEEFKSDLESVLGTYDFVGASGLLAEGHANNTVFDEMLMSLKVGGIAVFTSRVEYLESLGYQKGIDERIASRKWELVKSEDYEKYSNAKDNPIGRFKPTISRVYAFKKL